MECSIPASGTAYVVTSRSAPVMPKPVVVTTSHKDGPPKSLLHVNFDTQNGELTDRKKKYLTAKYGKHQMELIKKRLRVEMWMYEQLQTLYNCSDDSNDIEIDLDELLDLEEELNRKDWLRKKLTDAKQSKDTVESFILELLEKAKTL